VTKKFKMMFWLSLGGVIFTIGEYVTDSSAQDATLDYYGEIEDSEHPAGYRDYVEMGCWQCHGFQGQGANSPPLVANLLPYAAFVNQVRRPINVMPAYSLNVLGDEKLRAIYSYLDNIPSSPDVSEIPLLSRD